MSAIRNTYFLYFYVPHQLPVVVEKAVQQVPMGLRADRALYEVAAKSRGRCLEYV